MLPPLSQKEVSGRIISKFKIPKSPPPSDFASDVLKHIKKTANLKQAIKLSKLNKYFIQEKCSFVYIGGTVEIYKDSVSFWNQGDKYYQISEIPNNLGIDRIFHVYYENLLPQLISKILICDIKRLYIYSDAKISFDDFKFLTSSESLLKLGLYGKVVEKDEIVPYETLLENAPSLRHFSTGHLSPSQLTNNFFEKICASKLEKLFLYDLTKFFDVETFLNSMKKKPNLHIHFQFEESVDPGNVNAHIDKLVAADKHDSRPPEFHNAFLDAERCSQLRNLQNAYNLKIRGDG